MDFDLEQSPEAFLEALSAMRAHLETIAGETEAIHMTVERLVAEYEKSNALLREILDALAS